MHVPEVTAEAVDALERYADTVYLTQTFERRDGELTRFLNLEDAIAAYRADPGGPREWRVHFHVPVFLDDLGPFRTTRFAIADAARGTTARTTSRTSSRSRPTPGTCCPPSSSTATSSSTSRASSNGCATS